MNHIRQPTNDPRPDECVLVTGYPAFTARRMVRKVLGDDGGSRVLVLARDKFAAEARAELDSLPDEQAGRAEVISGDICDMDLGLSGSEYRRLTEEVTTIHHLAGIFYMGVDKATARKVNVDGTRAVVELAGDIKRLRRLCHWSTASVAGKRRGVVLEEDLDEGQSFHNFYEHTKFQAEQIARSAQRSMPVTIFRPSLIVGDSRSGEIDKFDGPYYLMVLIVTNSLHVHLPLPGRGAAPLHLVPIDYVIDAAYRLSMDARAAGGTFHLVDPSPLPARKVYELVAERSQSKPPRGVIPKGLARTLLKTPGLERLARAPLAFLETFDQQVYYNARNTLDLLDGTDTRCPAFDSYVDAVVRYVREVYDARAQSPEDEVFDPFD